MTNTLRFYYADDYLIVAEKPANLLSVPGRGPEKADCLISRVQKIYPDALIVHRLDHDTSGLMVIARGPAMHRALSMAFQAREVDKYYEAIVAGHVVAEKGSLDYPLIVDWPNRPRQHVNYETGKPSLTHYTVLARDAVGRASHVGLVPHTGRSHQLRVHMATLGHPILGDELYGDPTAAPRLLLHASSLGFTHPHTGAAMQYQSPAHFTLQGAGLTSN